MLRKFITLCTILTTAAAFAGPSAKWLETTHNFGAFDEDLGPVSCDFLYVNTSSEPLSITAARSSCGCTSPVYDRTPVAPGDTGRVHVSYDPAGRPGSFTKTVSIQFSDSSKPDKLYIKGIVVGSPATVAQRYPAACTDGLRLAKGVVMTGEILKGQMRTAFLDGYNGSTDTIRPTIADLPEYIEASAEPAEVPPGQQFSFIFYVRTAKCPLYGVVNDSVTIRPDRAADSFCTVPVVTIVNEDFSSLSQKDLDKAPSARLDKTTIDFDRLSAYTGSPVLTCTLTNNGKKDLKIRRIYTQDPGVAVSADSYSIRKGHTATITVTIDPRALPGDILNARISLITNDPANPIQTIRVVGLP
ncbi:MAG: DUF1573 domain-containing protein [Muribaculaceae bacterium]|nr:DUF1573 domain-containing protein [Muribaculaceae bacterium]